MSRIVMVLLLIAGVFAACGSGDRVTPKPDGKKEYAQTCALCHGDHGEGYVADSATALASPTFLSTATDGFLARSIAHGRPGTTMSAWDTAHDGPYDDAAIEALVQYLRTWQTTRPVTLSTAPVVGDPVRGAGLYEQHCRSCHGATGEEGPDVRLANPEFLATASDAYLQYAISAGRPGTEMVGWWTKLGNQDIADIVARIRSWQRPVAPGDVAIPGTFGPFVQNEGGPEPGFVLGQRYTPADIVHGELMRGAAMVFLDARAPSDYGAGHVKGAIDLPFYETAQYADALPKDRWIVCYCACPHAESGHAADALFAAGFTKVTIIDEGFFVWRDRGYPVTIGPKP